MKLYWTEDAINDRMSIYEYIEAENPLTALGMDELFSEQAKLLVQHPEIGRLGRVAKTRELVVHKSFVLVYSVAKDTVYILRLLHTSRPWFPFSKR